ncbi:oxygenase MpaB family protein [Actinomadura atramentaria]|uniref:oxygenase MpaB family protein n=1 Tax=Actinomadura atramentaria TaxID=1990 RepID=UPI000379009A|nr:oxygenase MpaB family protein [Actinomadura atramentaria]
MTTSEVAPPATAGPAPRAVADTLSWFALNAATANVIMQLALLPVGHGVAESKVESGRADLHPVKRLRTTLSYVAVAWWGTEDERLAMRAEVNRSHRHVHSAPGDPVKYNAFDRDLQLWVAACLYRGTVDVLTVLHGRPDDAYLDTVYAHASRLATTLQVPRDRWPRDRAAFAEYWETAVRRTEMDDVTRRYLRDLIDLRGLPRPVRRTAAPFHRFVTTGFLPPLFREQLGLTWTRRDQRRFNAFTRVAGLADRALPRAARCFPWNVYLWDARRRIRGGRPIV